MLFRKHLLSRNGNLTLSFRLQDHCNQSFDRLFKTLPLFHFNMIVFISTSAILTVLATGLQFVGIFLPTWWRSLFVWAGNKHGYYTFGLWHLPWKTEKCDEDGCTEQKSLRIGKLEITLVSEKVSQINFVSHYFFFSWCDGHGSVVYKRGNILLKDFIRHDRVLYKKKNRESWQLFSEFIITSLLFFSFTPQSFRLKEILIIYVRSQFTEKQWDDEGGGGGRQPIFTL